MVTLAHSCVARKTLIPSSQIELTDYMSFHSASTVRTFQQISAEPPYSRCVGVCTCLKPHLQVQLCCAKQTAPMFLMVCLEKCICSCTLGNKNKHMKRFRLVKSTSANSVFLYIILYFKPKKEHRQHLG